MGEVYDFFLSSYSDYSRVDIILEFLAFWFGIVSVVFAKKQNILVYPTGIICTIITMYLMYKVSLLGHILVNLLYTIIIYWIIPKIFIWTFDCHITSSKRCHVHSRTLTLYAISISISYIRTL